MTESEWLSSDDPQRMLTFLRSRSEVSDRKYRLFACGAARVAAGELLRADNRRVLDISERYSDGNATERELSEGRQLAHDMSNFRGLMLAVTRDVAGAMLPFFSHDYLLWVDEHARYCPIIRCTFGNPFCPSPIGPEWRTSSAVSLAAAIYESRDFSPMPVLADCLEESGCDDPGILQHCRQVGVHVRGCWVVDLVLGKT